MGRVFFVLVIAAIGVHAAYAHDLSRLEKEVIAQQLNDDFSIFVKGGKTITGEILGIDANVSAQKIFGIYKKNEVLGNKKFYKKKILVTGNVLRIDSDIGNVPYLTLGNSSGRLAALFGVITRFKDEGANIDKIASLRKGNQVTLVCTGKGRIGRKPILIDCVFPKSLRDKMHEKLIHGSSDTQKKLRVVMYVNAVATAQVLKSKEACNKNISSCLKLLHSMKDNKHYGSRVKQKMMVIAKRLKANNEVKAISSKNKMFYGIFSE